MLLAATCVFCALLFSADVAMAQRQVEGACSARQLFVFVLDASQSMQSIREADGRTRWDKVMDDFRRSVDQLPTDGSAEVVIIIFAGQVAAIPLDKVEKAGAELRRGVRALFEEPFLVEAAGGVEKGAIRGGVKPRALTRKSKPGLLQFLELLAQSSDLPSSTNCYDAMGVGLKVIGDWAAAGDVQSSDARLTFYTDGEQTKSPSMYYPFGGRSPKEVNEGVRAAWTSPWESKRTGEWSEAKRRYRDGKIKDIQSELSAIRAFRIPLVVSTLSIGREAEALESSILPLDPEHRRTDGLVEFSTMPLSQRKARIDFDVRRPGGGGPLAEPVEAELKAGSATVPLDLVACVFDPSSRVEKESVQFEWRPLARDSSATVDARCSPRGTRVLPLRAGAWGHSIELSITGASAGETIRGVLAFRYPDSVEGAPESSVIEIRTVLASLPKLVVETESLTPGDRSIHVLTGESVLFDATVPEGASASWTVTAPGVAPAVHKSGGPVVFTAAYGTVVEHAVKVEMRKPGFRDYVGEWTVTVYGLDVLPQRSEAGAPLFVGGDVALMAGGEAVLEDAPITWQWSRLEGSVARQGPIGPTWSAPLGSDASAQLLFGLQAVVDGNRLPYDGGRHAPRTLAIGGLSERPIPEIRSVQPSDSVVEGGSFELIGAVRGATDQLRGLGWQVRREVEGADWEPVSTDGDGRALWVPARTGRYALRFTATHADGRMVASEYPTSVECREKVRRLVANTPLADEPLELMELEPATFEVRAIGDIQPDDHVAFFLDDVRVVDPKPVGDGTVSVSIVPKAGSAGSGSAHSIRARLTSRDGVAILQESMPIELIWRARIIPARVSSEIIGVQTPSFGAKEVYKVLVDGASDGIEVEWSVGGPGAPFATPKVLTASEVELLFDRLQGEHTLTATLFRNSAGRRERLAPSEQPPARKLTVIAKVGVPRVDVLDDDPPSDDKQLVEGGSIQVTVQPEGIEDVTALEVRIVAASTGAELHPARPIERGRVSTYLIPATPGRYLVEARTEVPGDGTSDATTVRKAWQTVAAVDNREVRYEAVCVTPEVLRVTGRALHLELRREQTVVGEDYVVEWSRRLQGGGGEPMEFGSGSTIDHSFPAGSWEVIANVSTAGRSFKVGATLAVSEPSISIEAEGLAPGKPTSFRLVDQSGRLDNVTSVRWLVEARHEGEWVKVFDRTSSGAGSTTSPAFVLDAPEIEYRLEARVSLDSLEPLSVWKPKFAIAHEALVVSGEDLPIYAGGDEVLMVSPAPVGVIRYHWSGRPKVAPDTSDEGAAVVLKDSGASWEATTESSTLTHFFEGIGPQLVSVEMEVPVGEDQSATGSRRIIARHRVVDQELTVERRPNYVAAAVSAILGGLLCWILWRLGRGTQDMRKIFVQWTAIAPPEDGEEPVSEFDAWSEARGRTVWIGRSYSSGGWTLGTFWTKRLRLPVSELYPQCSEGRADRDPHFSPPDWFTSHDRESMGDIELQWTQGPMISLSKDCFRSTRLQKEAGSRPRAINASAEEYTPSVKLSLPDGTPRGQASVFVRLHRVAVTPHFDSSVLAPIHHVVLWWACRPAVAMASIVVWMLVTTSLLLNA